MGDSVLLLLIFQSGRSEEFDCVVLTMPVPQILQVAAEFLAGKPDLKSKLETVKYR